jgi:hypothetical protein
MLFQPAEINHTPKIVLNKHHSGVMTQLFQERKVIPDGSFSGFYITTQIMFTTWWKKFNTDCEMIWMGRNYCYFELKEKQWHWSCVWQTTICEEKEISDKITEKIHRKEYTNGF